MKSVQIGCRNFFFTQNLKIFRNKISRFFQKISKFKSIESIKLEAQLKVYCTHFTIETTYLIIFRDMHFKYTSFASFASFADSIYMNSVIKYNNLKLQKKNYSFLK